MGNLHRFLWYQFNFRLFASTPNVCTERLFVTVIINSIYWYKKQVGSSKHRNTGHRWPSVRLFEMIRCKSHYILCKYRTALFITFWITFQIKPHFIWFVDMSYVEKGILLKCMLKCKRIVDVFKEIHGLRLEYRLHHGVNSR